MGKLIDYIKSHHNTLSYAQSQLHMNINKPGDRTTSIAPGPHTHTNAFVLLGIDYWYDHTLGRGGDVIDLCAWAKYNGDYDSAYKELSYGYVPDNPASFASDTFRRERLNLVTEINMWHDYLTACAPDQLEYLHSRRITDETISKLRIGYCKELQRIIVPYWRNGEIVYWAGRDRSPAGTVGKDGKAPSKYMKMKQTEYFTNLPWGLDTLNLRDDTIIHTKLGDFRKDEILVVSEGIFDVMSFYQELFKCLSPVGGYFRKDLMPYIASICRSVKVVVTAFDSDTAGQNFTKAMSQFYVQNRIPFLCVNIPAGNKDISEFYAAGGDLTELVENADIGLHVVARSMRDETEFKNFMIKCGRFADKADLLLVSKQAKQFDKDFVRACYSLALKGPSDMDFCNEIISDNQLLFIDNVGFYQYQHGQWMRRSDTFIKSIIQGYFGDGASYQKIMNIFNLLKVQLVSDISFNKSAIFNCNNGVYDLNAMKFVEHSPEYYSTVQVHYDYNESAKCPLWEKCVNEWMNGDKNKIMKLQEMFGQVLVPDNRFGKAFILKGNGANGKSVVLDIMRALFGDDQCTSTEISKLGENFQAVSLRDSILNISDETDLSFKKSEAMFKRAVTGGRISDSFKGQDVIQFVTRAKFVIASNNYITSNDVSYGLMRRIEFIDFTQIFTKDKADLNLVAKLKKELPGILNWAIKGFLRLMASNGFTQTSEQEKIQRDFMTAINPVANFLDEDLCYAQGISFTHTSIYSRYKEWCQGAGNAPVSRKKLTLTLAKLLPQMMPHVIITQHGSTIRYEFPVDEAAKNRLISEREAIFRERDMNA